MVKVNSWGRLSNFDHELVQVVSSQDAASIIKSSGHSNGLPFGMGRSYGDSCLNPGGSLWMTNNLSRFLSFNPVDGVLRCEAGIQLRDIQDVMIPKGWALPVTPGTQFVTVGGAIANDVHGKNHHVSGSFGNHLLSFHLIRTDGTVIVCAPDQNSDWFEATVGGLGLTGLIVQVELKLKRISGPWLDTEAIPFSSLDTFFQLSDESERRWEYTVSWIDCLHKGSTRGIFMRANHVASLGQEEPNASKRTMPIVPPFSLVNRFTLQAFNTAYYELKKRNSGRKLIHYKPFFYPLDNILEWNRIYGPRGFYQYQMVVPRDQGYDSVAEVLAAIAASGQGSFLAVLKTFGNQRSRGMLSFPQPGVTLALDFPNNGSKTHALFTRLDAIVRRAKGRLYLAKDARMSRDFFEECYPNFSKFINFRDPGISSSISRRLMGI